MTHLQEKEFKILEKFIQVCEELKLDYFLVCGSALGAVKYGGFIPWDDDIDVALFRDDYNRFINEAPILLPPNLFLQNCHSEEKFPTIYSKLRDSETTFIEKSAKFLPINHGIYIDVFPLDGYPKGKIERSVFEIKKKIHTILISSAYDVPSSWKHKLLKETCKFIGVDKNTQIVAKSYEKFISKYPVDGSDIICNHGNWQGKLEYSPKWHYGNGTMMKFESLDVRVPENYDAYLTQKYGDWRADLPEEQKCGHHYYAVCDLNRPYTDYIEKLSNEKIKIKRPKELDEKTLGT